MTNKTSTPIPKHNPAWEESKWRSQVRRKLLQWFSKNARDMPWRSDPTPYHVWVSEIMLQQTQVATVIPYFLRFIEQFPNIAELADADESELMKLWEGLGYYRRARSLHKAAKQIIDEHNGVFPTTYEQVLALPGVGRYTAGAILSISGNQRLPILEGNTIRLFSRLVGLRAVPTEKSANQLLWTFSEKMLPRSNPGIFNQAVMELGALVCTPKKPACNQCPLRHSCAAYENSLQDVIPGKISKTKYEDRTEYAFVVSQSNTKGAGADLFLVRPLPDDGRWAGLWDFPRPTDEAFDSVQTAADWLESELGQTVQPGIRLTMMRHAVTKYRIQLHVHVATLQRSRKRLPAPWRYVTLDELDGLPMSVTARKICEFLRKDTQQKLPI